MKLKLKSFKNNNYLVLFIIYFKFGHSITLSILKPNFSYSFLAIILESNTVRVKLSIFLSSKIYYTKPSNAFLPNPFSTFFGFLPKWCFIPQQLNTNPTLPLINPMISSHL